MAEDPTPRPSPERETLADIIEDTLGWTNGWRISDKEYHAACLVAADRILAALRTPEPTPAHAPSAACADPYCLIHNG